LEEAAPVAEATACVGTVGVLSPVGAPAPVAGVAAEALTPNIR